MATTGRRPRARCPFPLPRALVAVAALAALPAVAAVQSAAIVSDPGADSTYARGDAIEVAVSFEEVVHVDHADPPSPGLTFRLQVGATVRSMPFAEGSGSRRLLFRYRVPAGDLDTDGISFGTDAITGGTLTDGRGAPVDHVLPAAQGHDRAHKVDAVPPQATLVAVVSDPGEDATYAAGDHIDVAVSFDEDIDVPDAPELLISVGELSRAAALLDTRPRRLTFRYVVRGGDRDTDGIAVQAGALRGGTITDKAGNPAVRTQATLDTSAGHKVDAIAPQVTGIEIASDAGSDDTYVAGDAIEVSVVFDEIMHVITPCVTAQPLDLVLLLSVGELTRAADFVGGSGTQSLRFRYVVQVGDLDDDGISVGPTSLQGGCLRDHAGNVPEPPLMVPPVPAQAAHKVNAGGLQPPLVTGVEIVSRPQSGATYGTGEAIEVDVTFDKQVHVTGEPVLTISVGANSRDAGFATGSGTTRLTFRYTVQEGDRDDDGISIAPNALRQGVIEDSVGNAAVRTFTGVPADPGHRVRGLGSVQANLAIVSAPRSGDTYGLEEDIEVTVTFAGVVHVTGDPILELSIGGNTRAATFTTGSGTRALRFRYTVQAGDLDEDGISIASGALQEGEITSGTGGVVAVYFPALPAQPRHKVNGIVGPRVTAVRLVSQPASSGDTYGPGEQIDVAVVFDAAVHVTGNPVLGVSVGPSTRSAAYLAGSGTDTLTFRYTVQEGDVDADGISVAANALSGGAISGASGDPVSRIFVGLPAQSGHKVDAARPTVLEVGIVSTPARDQTYALGDAIEVAVTFDDVVHVTGDPVLTLSVGGVSRPAALVSGSGTETLTFRYTIQQGEVDEDGVSIAANALSGGVIADVNGNGVVLTFAGLPAQAGHQVDGTVKITAVTRVAIVSSPAQDPTYLAGEAIDVAVTFDGVVHVSGEPVLAVLVGGGTRDAALVSGGGTDTLTFRYIVREGDVDDDGVSIRANALTGGTIEDPGGNAVARTLAALPADAGHRVDAVGPTISGVRIVSTPERNATYEAGEIIEVAVTFDEAVHVTGNPVLTLSIGGGTREAVLASGSGTNTLTFGYTIQQGEVDEDGVSIAANALLGGVIADINGNGVVLTFDGLPAQADHKVDGTVKITAVTRVAVVSSPGRDQTYLAGEAIDVAVTFDGVVHVGGEPVLALLVGGGTREAGLVSGSGTDTLTFRYVVREGDNDDDGVSIAANVLTGGTIEDAGGTAVTRAFAALPADAAHRVDAVGPTISGVRIVSTPERNATYEAGEIIEVAVTFDEAVHVTGNPVLTLSIGGGTREAVLASGSGTNTLTFGYRVREGDGDEDGVSIAANALTGGVVEDAGGNAVTRAFAALPADAGQRVDAVAPTVSEVRIVSTPAGNDAYEEDEVIEFDVTFNEVVHVTGSPVLTLSMGGGNRQAALASGSGTRTLLFGYVVGGDDRDEDGISVAANALTGGVIDDGHGNEADRTFEALPAAARHKVYAATPAARVLEVGISSRPAAAGMYAEGEGIEITVTFDRAVHVTGDPVLTLSVGGRSRAAALASGSGTPSLVFRYVVQSGDVDDDGVSVAANALAGGAIEDADGQAADLRFDALAAQDGHRVGPEITVELEVPALSIGTPWTADLAGVLTEVGVRNYGALVAASEHPGVVGAHASGTVVTVTPVGEGVGTVVVTATNARLVLSLTVTVGASAAEKAVLGDALATIGRGLLWSATNTIGTRLDMAGDATIRQADVRYAVPESGLSETGWSTGAAADGVPGAMGGPPDAAGLSWQTTGQPTQQDFGFEMPLIGIGSQAVSWGVWGGGDYWAFDSEPEAGAYDGDMASGYLGVDARGEAWVAGVAVSHAQADVSYEFGGEAAGAGTLETELTTVHPYVQWSPHDRARLWAILGFGTGEALAVRDGEEAGPPADLSMSMAVAGLRFDLGRTLGVDLAVRGDAGFVELETGDGLAAVEGLSVGVHQVRVGVEGSWPLQFGGATLVPFVDIGGRFDGGDGQTGGALEVAGGVRFRSPNVGVELKGRTVAMHAVEGYSENGLSAAIVVGPSTDGRGWSLSLAPRWGGAADMTDMLWRRDYRRGMGGMRPGWGLAGRVGYGAGLAHRPGLVTSFGEFDLSERDRRRMRFGVSYRLRGTSWQPPVYLELAGERVELYPVETDHRLVLTGRAHF